MVCSICKVAGHNKATCAQKQREAAPVVVPEAAAAASAEAAEAEEREAKREAKWKATVEKVRATLAAEAAAAAAQQETASTTSSGSATTPHYLETSDPHCVADFHTLLTVKKPNWATSDTHGIDMIRLIKTIYQMDPSRVQVNGGIHNDDAGRTYYSVKVFMSETNYWNLHVYGTWRFNRMRNTIVELYTHKNKYVLHYTLPQRSMAAEWRELTRGD
jgi:hypothetical protein